MTTPNLLQLLSTAILGPLLFGYHLAELNAPQQVITCAQQHAGPSSLDRIKHLVFHDTSAPSTASSLPQCIPMNPTQFGLVSSSFTLGGLLGALSAGPVAARYGRLRAMIYLSAFAVVGPLFEAAAPNVGVMALGRLIAGIGAGGATVVVPIYISEISPPSKRGFFGAFTQIATNCGILITQALGLFLSKGQLWRIILAVGGAIALLQMLGLVLAGQESPKYLADMGEISRAKSVLRKLRGLHADIDDEISALGTSVEQYSDDEEANLLSNHETTRYSSNNNKKNNNKKDALGFFEVTTHPDTKAAVISVIAIMVVSCPSLS